MRKRYKRRRDDNCAIMACVMDAGLNHELLMVAMG